jgi:hypothetical protein
MSVLLLTAIDVALNALLVLARQSWRSVGLTGVADLFIVWTLLVGVVFVLALLHVLAWVAVALLWGSVAVFAFRHRSDPNAHTSRRGPRHTGGRCRSRAGNGLATCPDERCNIEKQSRPRSPENTGDMHSGIVCAMR